MPDRATDRAPIAQPLTRRRFLHATGQAIATLPILGAVPALATVSGAAAAPSQTRAGEWGIADAVSAFTDTGTGEFAAPFPFTALGAHWAAGADGPPAHLEVSLSADGATWTPWQTLHEDHHGAGPTRADRVFTALLHPDPSRGVRFRTLGPRGEALPAPPDLRFVYIDASSGPTTVDLDSQLSAFVATMPRVVTRAGWGANEKLRFDKNGKEIWTPEYYTTEKIIIHHTETSNTQDPIQAIRAIYYYHAVTREWGDIGYNFLVDRNGVVYEGRHGGENVVGGHALKYNYGSVGIGIIGSFTSTPIPAAAEAAVIQLAAYKGRYLNPQTSYYFFDKLIPSIVGHRDCLSTACPGDAGYPRLPAIRQGVAKMIGTGQFMDVAVAGIAGVGSTAFVQTPYTVTVTVRNTGTAVLPSDYNAGLIYAEGDSYTGKNMAPGLGRFRVVAEVEGAAKSGPYQYRWGFGRSLNPGETIEVKCRIAFGTVGTKKLRFGLIQEGTGLKQQGLEGPTVRVAGLPTAPVEKPVDAGEDVLYFAASGHTLRGALRRYWEKFGGLAQFGYPLTEEFLEVSETDGREYLVQYFERARFEHHPENEGSDYEVLLGLVGLRYHALDKRAAPLNRADTRYFEETGHNLGGFFRVYWEEYGGLFVYGYPLTEEFTETSRIDGKPYTVQYFERARFEYHPENTGKSRVLLGHLGRQLLQDRGWLK